jgi:beta-lactamase class A
MSATLSLLLVVLPAVPSKPEGLAARLAPLVKAFKGKVAVAVRHLESGESYYFNADEVMPTASLIKVAVLLEAYLQADEGKLRLTDLLTLRQADKVPGSGLLTYHFSEGARLPVRDACRLMIAFSDNTATNLVLDRVGLAAVNKRLAGWGLKETRINHKVFLGDSTSIAPARSRRYGLGSTTAREMAALFEELAAGARVRSAVKQALLGHLRKNTDHDKFSRFLPAGARLAHKDGSVGGIRTDAGVLYTPGGAVVVVVLTDGPDRRFGPDNAGSVLCAKVAKAVYDHFNTSPAPGPGR